MRVGDAVVDDLGVVGEHADEDARAGEEDHALAEALVAATCFRVLTFPPQLARHRSSQARRSAGASAAARCS